MKNALILLFLFAMTIIYDALFTPTTLADEIATTSLSMTPTDLPQAGVPVTITALSAEASGKTVYYKFYYCANYGADSYATTPWTVVQDYSTTNSALYTFPAAGNYVVVVRAVTNPNSEPLALPIIGKTITVGGDDNVNITAMSSTAGASITAGQAITCAITASSARGETLYYKFYYCANYGTASYDSTSWTVVQNYSTNNTCSYVFPTDGHYVMVARVVTDPQNEPDALPIVGCAISIDSANNFAGEWEGTWESAEYGLNGTFTADITQENSVLSGKIEVPDIGLYDADLKGTATGNSIVFGDIGDRIIFTGTMSASSSASGTYAYAAMSDEGDWQATKTSGGQSETVSWQKTDMGFAFGAQNNIIIGDGRGDGSKKVYTGDSQLASSAGNIYEFAYTNGQWQKIKFGTFETAYGTDDLSHITGMGIGPGQNDGINRVYCAGYNAAEYSYGAGTFIGSQICSNLQWINDLIVGDARRDGKNRIFLAGWSEIHELTRIGNGFSVESIDTGSTSISKLLLIDGRNDGVLRLYAATSWSNHVFEYTWSGGQWQVQDCGAVQGVNSISDMDAGHGRNDGVNRIYLAGNGGIFELSYNGANWQSAEIGSASNAVAVTLGPGRDSDIPYLYVAENQNALVEYAYAGGWKKASVLLSGQTINDIAVGDGRNNGTTGVYATAGDNHVYEFNSD
ncbi:MAG: hypothetical protein V2B19_09725 [Pseudomonadota bacterium]